MAEDHTTMTPAQERAADYALSELTALEFLLRDVGLTAAAERLNAFDLMD